MEYRDAIGHILSYTDFEKSPATLFSPTKFDLRRMEGLLSRLGDPHKAIRSVHIAGTKGKGSTAAMVASVLSAAGYRTGLYTSPHLHTFRERIRIDNAPISEEDFAALTEAILPEVEAVDRWGAYGSVTTFEILTTLAFAYFRQQGADFQVLEVGMGGRLDATNVVNPEVCIITSISYDHTEILGDTLAKIAGEKAAIIKPKRPVVSSPQYEEAAEVIRRVSKEKGAELTWVGRDVTWQKKQADLSGQSFEVKGIRGRYELRIPLLGDHQLDNACAAVAALEHLRLLGVSISGEAIASGLRGVQWPGRLQILGQEPLLVVDGAHNGDSMKRLREALMQYFKFQNAVFIIGISQDKDIEAMVRELLPISPKIIATRSRHPRAAEPQMLVPYFQRYGMDVQEAENTKQALAKASAMAGPKDLICATGSLFVVAEAIEAVRSLKPELIAP